MKFHLPAMALLALSLSFAASAATPADGALTLDSGPLAYTGGPLWIDNPTSQVGLGQCFDSTVTCDIFTLTVDLPADYEITHPYGLVVASIVWPTRANDFELFVIDADGNPVAGNSSSNDPETIAFPALAGQHVYQVITYPNIAPPGDIVTGALSLVDAEAPHLQPGPTLTFADHKPPEGVAGGSGEPTLGIDSRNGAVLFMSGITTYKVTMDEAHPGVSAWNDVSSPWSLTSLDPILAADAYTGRIFQSQLLGVTSLLSFSDDDGASWLPSEGSGIPGGVDHQSLGAGRYPAQFQFLSQNPLYPDPLYYCSQDLFTALCARSDDGGVTFTPPVPMYTTECAGIHGHVKVAPDGTVYVPNKGCFYNGEDGQAVLVSEDAGFTWHLRMIPDTQAAQGSDPSVGVGADGTVYFGYQSVEGRARIVVSHDRGLTWEHNTDVSAPIGVRNIVFPAVAAGDADRAVFAFHGAVDKGVGYTEGYPGIWHLYIATTFDGGQHWVTQNATPDDPVQREGGICLGGIGCSGNNRNLLDFIDVAVDPVGRIVVSYADGCVGECLTGGENTFDNVGSVVRQTGGPRMFSAFDPPGTVISYEPGPGTGGGTPPPVATADSVRFGGALGFLTLLPLLFAALFARPAQAGAPVTLTDANTQDNPLRWTSGPFVVGTSNASCGAAVACEDTPLTIAVSPGVAATMRVVSQIEWGVPTGADFDLYIMRNDNLFAASAGTADPEIARFDVENGDFVVHVEPYQPLGNSFTTTIYLEAKRPSTAPPIGPAPSYAVFAPPDNAAEGGEPSIGASWQTDSVVVGNSSQAWFVTFDDSAAPATATWANRPPPTNLISFDPILFTDRETGRTITSQLVSDVVLFTNGCSLSWYTDDDGATWVPSEGCGPPAGADHQAVGGGPYHAPLTGLGSLYPHAVYYCAQSVGVVVADSTCSRSDDGGLTYGPAHIVYTTQCGGIHGHPRVAPDGTVYLPNKICGETGERGQGVAISTDNGETWSFSQIPGSTPANSDPSVATGLNDVGKPEGQLSNTVYFGYCDSDGLPKVAVSPDQGATWTNIFNVGAAADIRNCAFPEMIAGDDDRAALFFLGTTTPGNFGGADFAGEWHAYVATTFDGGASWGVSDATPDDPVQIGCIWLNGGSNPCRNLLDFNDISVDREGRPVFVFADGCVPPECTAGATPEDSRTAVNTIGRQSGGPRLFAEFDPPVVPPVTPPPTSNPPPVATTVDSSRFGGALDLALIGPFLLFFARRRRPIE